LKLFKPSGGEGERGRGGERFELFKFDIIHYLSIPESLHVVVKNEI
jgi:hypothetical protein